MLQKFKLLDPLILVIIACFAVISTMVIQSATSGTSYEGLHYSNMVMYAALFLPMLAGAFFDYRMIIRYSSYLLYGVGIILLILVLTSGVHLNGATRWINLGGIQFQPSEIVKIFVILTLAKFLGDREGHPLRLWREVIPSLAIAALPIFLILKQPDLGTSVVYISILIGMLWIANIRLSQVIIGIAATIIAAVLITATYFMNEELFFKIIKPHQFERIQTFIDPTADPQSSWHVSNARIAISTGEFSGKGFQSGYFVQNGYIPYDYADSIFVVIGEEFGFIGSSLLILLYFILIYRMIIIAYNSTHLYGTYLVTGIIAMFVLQIFENIAMHIGLMPLTGIALPFISYGGSSLLTNMIAISLVLSVQTHRRPLLDL